MKRKRTAVVIDHDKPGIAWQGEVESLVDALRQSPDNATCAMWLEMLEKNPSSLQS